MAYIGNVPKTANFAIDTFNGDNATVNFTLRDAPATTSAILVFVGGIRQQTDSYTLSGTTLQFTEAPPTGTNNIQVLFLGIGTTTTVPADGTVSTIKIANQAVTGDKVAVASLGANVHIAASITGDKIGLNAITSNLIAANAVTGDKLGLTSVNANNIVSNAITSNLIASSAVTGDKIGLTAINANNIVLSSITNDRLAVVPATTGKAIAMSIVFGG
jgi:hypothetical protein